ncbi:hypothetical protein ACTFIW_008579 [Dictyostelium discoideum]
MLMNNQRDNLESYIIGVAIEYEKLKIIKVLVNEPYSMEVTRFNIDQAVQTCSTQFLDELLLMCDFELRETCKNFKLSLIHQSISNSKNNENNDILNKMRTIFNMFVYKIDKLNFEITGLLYEFAKGDKH